MFFGSKLASSKRILCLILAGAALTPALSAQAVASKTWSSAVNSNGDNSHYAPLTQITKANVSKLKVAWTYPSYDNGGYAFQPLVVGNRLYTLARNNSLVALDAGTGKEIWVHEKLSGISTRGMTYWQSKDGKDKRLIFAMHQQLQEIDADTGKSILTFGTQGFVDLRVGLDRPMNQIFRIQPLSPPNVAGDLVLLGSSPGENYMAPPGDVRAYDVRTGKLAWQFHTIPHPGEPGYETWQKGAYKFVGGGNVWGEITVDERHGMVFLPTSSSKYELYGGDRVGDNLFTDCLVALDSKTGKMLWYFQMIHHDIWDWDNVSAPQLLTVKHNGKMIDAVAEAGKTGFLYVFDRMTGKPLWPMEERPVPQTDFPGEKTAATQPFPTVVPPFAKLTYTVDDVNPYLPEAEREMLKKRVAEAKNGPIFTPPGWGDTIQMPSNQGASNWGTTAAIPQKGLMFVAALDAPAILHMTKEAPYAPVAVATDSGRGSSGLELYSQNCSVCHGVSRAGEIGPSLVDIDKRLSVSAIKSIIENGQGQMPSFAALGAEKIDSIAQYVHSPNLEVTSALRVGTPGDDVPSATVPPPANVVGSGGAPEGQKAPGAKLIGAGPYGAMAGLPYPQEAQQFDRYYTNWNVMRGINRPPWSQLYAYDLNTGTIKWKIPLGEERDLVAQGITGTGTRLTQRGVMTTATGLVFVACTDGKVRAFDDENGKELWSAELPGGSRGVSAIYEVDGREYLAVNATNRIPVGAISPLGASATGDSKFQPSYVVFALPTKAEMK